MSPFTRPELVVRRCDELLSVNQPLAALSSISEVFSSKRFRTTPLSTLEPILIKFLGLCVDLRKGRTAKEGLHMYKNVAQNTSVGSVEVVIQKFLERSREKLAEALAKVEELEGPAVAVAVVGKDGLATAEVEDLEASETPESILLGSVSEEKSRDRTYRTLVTPWLRFLWEAYRTALDILRNNARLEVLYQTVSHEAFAFCITHQRKTEFRRLSESLRSHLSSSQKYSHQSHSINLNDSETLQRHLDTRFQQLNTAVDLELWQEAFRTAEDIHGLVGMSKRAPKSSMMASFYEKMVKVFGVGQNYLFHAAAYGKLYSLHAARAAASGDKAEDVELEKLSSLVLLSALAVPIGSNVPGESGKRREVGDEGEAKGKLGRLAALLGLSIAPTRAGLISDALNRHVLKRVSPELRALYNILEVDFHPLSITNKIEPILAALEKDPETARYVEPLKDVVLARLFQQLAQVYASLKIDRVVKLAGFASDGEKEVTRKRVERFVTESCRQGDLDVTIDHASGSIKFDEDLFGSDSTPVASTSAYDKDLQPSAATLLRTHLTRLASTLYATLDVVSPDTSPLAAALVARTLAFADLEARSADERHMLLMRNRIILKRQEFADEQQARKQKEEAHQRTVRAALKAEEDAKKQKDDLRARELEKIRKDLAAQRQAEAIKMAEALAAKSGLKVDLKDIDNLDSGRLIQLQVEQIEKEKKDLAQKLTGVSKRIDHLERAFRAEEVPLLKLDYERQQTRDREAHESGQALRVEIQRKQHAEDVEIKHQLAKIMPDFEAFRDQIESASRAEFEQYAALQREKLEEAKDARRQEVRANRLREAAAREAKRVQDIADAAQAEADRIARIESEAKEAVYKAESEALAIQQKEQAAIDRITRMAAREAEREAENAIIRQREARADEAAARKAAGIKTLHDESVPVRVVPGSRAYGAAQMTTSAPVAPSAGRRVITLAPRTDPLPVTEPVSAPSPSVPQATTARPGLEERRPTAGFGTGGGWREKAALRDASGTPPPSRFDSPASGPPGRSDYASPPTAGARPQIGSGKWSANRGAGDAPPRSESPKEGEEQKPTGAYRPPNRAPSGQNGGGGSRW